MKRNPLKHRTDNRVVLDIPARRMWGWGDDVHGYCGETSFQMAGLFFGNYVSQERVRHAAGNAELLIGENDARAAERLHYDYDVFASEEHDTPQGPAFAAWARRHLERGHVVIAGFCTVPGTDEEYDHIQPVVGYSLSEDEELDGLLYYDLAGKELRLLDADGLVGEAEGPDDDAAAPYPDYYAYELSAEEALYAIAVTGVEDEEGELLRMKLSVGRWDEPDWGAEDGLDERPVALAAEASVYGLEVGDDYVILRFDDPDDVPSSGFLGAEEDAAATFPFTASATVERVDLGTVRSDKACFFRALRVGEA